MSSRYSLIKKEIAGLTQRLEKLKERHQSLLVEQRGLLLQHELAQAWCDGLSMLIEALSSSVHLQQPGLQDTRNELLSKELELLQQLSGAGGGQPDDAARRALHGAALVATLAPPSDPLALLRAHVRRPPMAGAATMTSLQLAKHLRQTTLEISMQLHVLQHLPPLAQGVTLQRLRELWDSYIHALVSCVVCGNAFVVEDISLWNLEELRRDVQGAERQGEQAQADIVRELQLSQQQVDAISAGMHVYERLVAAVQRERQALQAQAVAAGADGPAQAGNQTAAGGSESTAAPPAAAAAATDPSANNGSNSGSNLGAASTSSREPHGCSRSSTTSSTAARTSSPAEDLCAWHQQQEAEQQHAQRLSACLQKEYVLRLLGVGWFLGTLSLRQVSQAAVLSWPAMFCPIWLAAAVHRQHAVKPQAAPCQPPLQPKRERE